MLRLVLNSLRFYWRTHLGVLAGAVFASAVLTGALLVGDSVDFSLRNVAMMRLGDIHYAVNTRNQYVDEEFAAELSARLDAQVSAVLQLRGVAIYRGETSDDRVQVNQVEVLGVAEEFWGFADGAPIALGPNETALNVKLATALGVEAGDEISLRVAKPSLVARDAPLSMRGEERTRRAQYRVKAVVPDDAMGRFSLSASQVGPYSAFVNRAWLQEQVDLSERINLVAVAGGVSPEALDSALANSWQPEHIGLHLRSHQDNVIQLESDRIFLDPESARAAMTLTDARGTLTYLINSISKGDRSTPYSFVVAGPVPDTMRDDEIVINRWVADRIGTDVGDTIQIVYAELLATNDFVEKQREFTVHSIREMKDLVAERELMPTFPGLSDVESCSDWDVGMPMDDEILLDEANEEYWEEYHTTPKCFVTLAAGQEMWANRFGNLTAVRYPGGEERAAEIRDSLAREIDPALAGLFFQPVRDQADRAVSEAMDFGGLFLGMSFFLIVAALMLTGLLFAFGVQQRAREMGALLAMGFAPKLVRRLYLGESVVIAALGAALGAGLGAYYTRALIYGLAHYWSGAVAHASIQYHADTSSLAMGAVISFVCAMCAMVLAMWRQSKRSARELLTMDFTQEQIAPGSEPRRGPGLILSVSGLVLAIAIILFGVFSDAMDVMIPFFAAGSLLLLSGLGFCRYALMRTNDAGTSATLSLRRLALQNVARRRGRSLTVVGLLACGVFMVIAVSAMQEDLHAHAHHRSSGTGGYALLAEATFPLLEDPLKSFKNIDVSGAAIKVRDGDDASCLNLNHAQSPRVLGVNVEEFASVGAFTGEAGPGGVWDLLNLELEDGMIPALVGDTNTAMWTLKKKAHPIKGDVLLYQDESGNEAKVKLVGALPMRLSVFQGTILIADEHFARLYPSEAGHRMFLIDVPSGQEKAVAATLRETYDRFGLNAIPTVDRLLEFYAVETTYLAMFLVLGGLGLAIASIGMGVVVLRNLFERRGEFAMLRALGFSRGPIHKILFTEYGFLLVAGLGIGGIAAAVSVVPAFLATDSQVAVGVQVRVALLVLVSSVSCMTLAILAGQGKDDSDALRNE